MKKSWKLSDRREYATPPAYDSVLSKKIDNTKLRIRCVFLGFGGGGGGEELESAVFGTVGGGIDVDTLGDCTPAGGAGTIGMFSGGMIDDELALAGVAGLVGNPGGGAIGASAVWLCDPGNTAASELLMLALGGMVGLTASANDRSCDDR